MSDLFLYFDLGRVLINFDVRKMLEQVAAAAGIGVEKTKEVVFDSGLQMKYEAGQIDCREFHDCFSDAVGARCEFGSLRRAASDIFELNYGVLPIVVQLRAAGRRMGILSNTCTAHWEHCTQRYPGIIGLFDVHALSYRLKTIKPQAEIFTAAAELAGVDAREIFFVDDMPANVEAARAAGFDAEVFTGERQLAADLRARGVRCNY